MVIGRAPDTARAAPLVDAPLEQYVVNAASVSASHLAAWAIDGCLKFRDLGSRNGTWLRLPASATVVVQDVDAATLRLSSPGSATESRPPEPPNYRDETDFAEAMARCIQAWLRNHDYPARVVVHAASEDKPVVGGVTTIRLITGAVLSIQPERTVDGAFDHRLAQISRYVATQNTLFSAERETRDEGVILASASFRQVHRRVVELAVQGLPSLVLMGPSGTGKERLSQAFHRRLGRPGPLVTINCSTLSRDRVVADLFGAEAGAYTGAQRTMTGAVERADGGTLFLDEIGEIPLDVQPMLLRFLETGEYQRLGAFGRTRTSDVRVVVATNRDLRAMARSGSFREDLFFRLALEIVEVPSLRERLEDLDAYLQQQRLGQVSVHDALQPAALRLLRAHTWDGNFRELVNLVRRLPRPIQSGSLDEEQIARALQAGALTPLRSSSAPAARGPASGWTEWLAESAASFAAASEHGAPTSWAELTAFVEQYLKPYALAHLGEVQGARSLDEVSIPKVADHVKADRGTVIKQLRRFIEAQSAAERH